MISITTKSPYALQALTELGQAGEGPVPIGELASKSTFEETVFLLWNGRLPKRGELTDFTTKLRENYELDKNVAKLVTEMPKTAEPMHVLRTLVSALGCYDPKPNAIDIPSIIGGFMSRMASM